LTKRQRFIYTHYGSRYPCAITPRVVWALMKNKKLSLSPVAFLTPEDSAVCVCSQGAAGKRMGKRRDGREGRGRERKGRERR